MAANKNDLGCTCGRITAVRRQYITPPEPRFFDQATAAAYLGISERTFEAQWRSYKMPYPRKIGRRCVWDRKILDHWADVVSGLVDPLVERSTPAKPR